MNDVEVWQGDCRELMARIPEGGVDAIVTDPPYPEEFWPLLAEAAPEMARVLRDGGEMVCLVGNHQLPFAIEAFAKAGLRYWWTCGMQHHTKGRMLGKRVVTTWKPALWFIKGKKRSLDDMPMDLVMGNRPGKREHEWEQGLSWFLHWCDRICDPSELILDPFAGSGTTGVACLKTGRRAILMEVEPRYIPVIHRRLRDAATPLFDSLGATL
jgi:adenine-specific DNA-methyltransferase